MSKPDQLIVTIYLDHAAIAATSLAVPGLLVSDVSDDYSYRVTGPLPLVVRAIAYHQTDLSADQADALADTLGGLQLADLGKVFR